MSTFVESGPLLPEQSRSKQSWSSTGEFPVFGAVAPNCFCQKQTEESFTNPSYVPSVVPVSFAEPLLSAATKQTVQLVVPAITTRAVRENAWLHPQTVQVHVVVGVSVGAAGAVAADVQSP